MTNGTDDAPGGNDALLPADRAGSLNPGGRPVGAAADPVVREAEPGDEPALLGLFESCEDWFVAVTGLPSAPGDVQSLYYALPEGAAPDAKRILVVEAGGTVVGVVDVVLRHPRPDTAAVGLFLLAPGVRRTGLGTRVARLLANRAAAEGIRRVTAAVPAHWPAGEAFVTALGGKLGAPSPVPEAVGNRRAGPRQERAVRRAVLPVGGR